MGALWKRHRGPSVNLGFSHGMVQPVFPGTPHRRGWALDRLNRARMRGRELRGALHIAVKRPRHNATGQAAGITAGQCAGAQLQVIPLHHRWKFQAVNMMYWYSGRVIKFDMKYWNRLHLFFHSPGPGDAGKALPSPGTAWQASSTWEVETTGAAGHIFPQQ